mmetsp:Transcript_11347/g.33420  ORF Transcript_11347/g.33420 Transcript_11347/m.33420 type:complete len:164 (-) Transcript_11347:276-767(-)
MSPSSQPCNRVAGRSGPLSPFVCIILSVMILVVRVNSFGASSSGLKTSARYPWQRYVSSLSNSKCGTTMFMNKGEGNDGESDLEQKIDDFLDSSVFDPDDEANEGNWFAQLVKNDYATAEALYAGGFFALMVFISQELFRMWLYGENYVPFKGGSASSGVWYE